jgi:hypothetical protein
MATTIYGWTLPVINGSLNDWGNILNTAFEDIDGDLDAADTLATAALARTGGTMTGALTTDVVTQPVETISAVAIDWSSGNSFTKTLSASPTFTFLNVPGTGAQYIVVRLVNNGSYTVTWPATINWPSGSAPTQTVLGTDIYVFAAIAGTVYGTRSIEDAS